MKDNSSSASKEYPTKPPGTALDQKRLLQATLDSSLEMIQVFKAVRDDHNQIIDFIWILNNHAAEQIYGDVIGKSLLQNNPGVVQEGIFDKFVEVVETGTPRQYEKHYVHEQFDGWFYQSVVKLDDGVATSTASITNRKQTEEKLRQLEAEQQREIFRVTLGTLEEERHRISESLHNGLGQLLYGVKISLSGLTQNSSPADFERIKTYTNQLLTEAIRESRRISHELMPTTLEEFGLKAALDDICEQLRGDIKFHCKVTGLKGRLEKYLELAVYRTVQELVTNVVKHAEATTASIEINIKEKQICIKVTDDGRGLEATKTQKPGIGLASIRSKIRLLNGEVNIRSKAGKGTLVEICIPLQEKDSQR